MAKWPAAGRCKSRLSKSVGKKRAAKIQERLLNHTLVVTKHLAAKGLIELQLSISGLGPKAAKRWGIDKGLSKVTLQGQGSLGTRMRKQIIHAQKKHLGPNTKGRPIIVIGSDLPNLCHFDLLKALENLTQNDIVIGPSKDGGYWLLGLSEGLSNPVPTWPFSGISWGTNAVLKQTLSKAHKANKQTFLLGSKNDLDTFQDLLPWRG
ncbi:TIGR04282 family arsenosugar biosynthesis glycosyltransferase [Prochlorococcus sp. MIT 1341]|uniref:TIGR04282 family arsenosugar biosynthesis glycosyltransferase n=1 Tax=Prochlorococcus sp. MIT 1341 TaxID=3096221 RepID=UPI002A756DE2|nr:TIGR04282 family arsenosugar biosynthesis glycosyltransferase [Prochlorococcus sp. MIT 1341]